MRATVGVEFTEEEIDQEFEDLARTPRPTSRAPNTELARLKDLELQSALSEEERQRLQALREH